MGAIRWPTGPFRIRSRPLGRVGRLIAWINILLGAGVLVLLSQIGAFQQYGLNLLASVGMGETAAEVRVAETDCTYLSGNRGGVHHCDVTLIDADGGRREIEVASSSDLEEQAAPRVARLLGRTALGYPLWLLLAQLFPLALALGFCGGMIYLGWYMLGGGALLLRRRFRNARIFEVDLLRRRMRNELLADWDFAWDDAARRRRSRDAVVECPVILDGIVTRGAALVPKRGKPRLLTVSYFPLDLDAAATLSKVQADVAAAYHATRPALPDRFLECVGADAAEREFVEGWRDAWRGMDAAEVNAGIERRHSAALKLSPERVDALLRRCRECVSA